MCRVRALVLCLLAPVALAAAAPAGKENLPLPEMVVSKATVPPTIDGEVAPGEWDRAPACTGFTVAFQGTLARVQSTAQITYDDQFLYVCLRNFRGPTYTLLKKRGRKPDDEGIVFDHSNEIWITPPVVPATTYQTLFNSYPGVFDVKMIPSVGYTAKSWKGNWIFASSETKNDWVVEAKAPIKSFGMERIADGADWRGLFTTDVLGDGDGFRAWAPGGGFAEINRHGTLRFRDNSPVFQLLDVESIFTGKPALKMAATGPAQGKSQVTITARFGPGVEAAPGDLTLTRTLALADGKHEELTLTGDTAGLNLPKKKVGDQEVPAGYCEVTARAEPGVLYHQVFPFVVDGTVRTPPAEIKASPYDTPFGLSAFYAPLNKKLIVKVDRYYLARRPEAVAGTARLLDAGGREVARRALAPFAYDVSEFPMDLAALKVPVQTEADWALAAPVEEENKKIAAENKKRKEQGQPEVPLKDVPGPKPAEYTLDVALATQAGQEIARTTLPVKLLGYQFEWLGNTVGITDKVIPPWAPLAWRGGTLSMWNKSYRLNGLGLAEGIVNAGAPQLSGPMRLVAVVGGKETPLKAGPAALRKLTEAAADFSGSASLGDLEVGVQTRAEFDGFVLNTMTLRSRRPTPLERLSLVVTMPRSEAPCFVTTAGGWSAYHGWTPEHWDSRETSSGTRRGNFVPYVFLTDSDRGFCWFADTDKGWILDPAQPTQELAVQGDTLTLRINFVTRSGELAAPTTLTYGWMVTPQKPQPAEWRATTISSHRPYPRAHTVFWNDADWAVLWPYYSSPYPWNYEKSAKMLQGAANNGVVGCPGNIAHAIARYRDYKGRWFTDLGADWGETPGDLSNGNVARSRGPNDFQVWHFDRWVKQSGLSGLYFDENYLGEDWNYLTGGATLLPDETIQPGYSYLGLREFDKRLRVMFHDNGKALPNLWLHTTSGQPVYAWMPDVAMEGENVEPTSLENDYIECLPAGRLRSIGMGRNLGAAALIMCQADRHWNDAFSPFCVQQFVGWVLAHDCLPEGSAIWDVLAAEMEMWRDDTRFIPYWKPGLGVDVTGDGRRVTGDRPAGPSPVTGLPSSILVSAHARPGHTILWVVNTAREDRRASVRLDLKKLGVDPARCVAFDAETGERCDVRGGTLSLDVPARMWRAVRLVQPKLLTGGETLVAHFDTEAAADEAFGHRYPTGRSAPELVEGKSGKGVSLAEAFTFGARHHVTAERGGVAFQLRCDAASSGTLLDIGGVRLMLNRGRLALQAGGKSAGEGTVTLPAGAAWHAVRVAWQGTDLTVSFDGAPALNAKLAEPLPIRPMGRGLEIVDYRRRVSPTGITFGPVRGGAIDDLVMSER